MAPAKGTLPPRLIEPATMKRTVRGKDTNTRYVCDILPQDAPAESLLVVEVATPSGHSSSYPPHKHDTDALPGESSLEETYYHRIDPAQGFVFQRVYTDDRSEDASFAVEDRDVVVPLTASPGGRAARLPLVLPQCDGRPEAHLEFQERPEARVDAQTLTAERFAFAQGAALAAGELALPYYRNRATQGVESKGLQDVVTVADKGVEAMLVARIAAAFPGDVVLGEEGGFSATWDTRARG
jgi:hypothetical protein